jgi:hypothetical protein
LLSKLNYNEYLKLLNRLYLHNLVWVSLRFSSTTWNQIKLFTDIIRVFVYMCVRVITSVSVSTIFHIKCQIRIKLVEYTLVRSCLYIVVAICYEYELLNYNEYLKLLNRLYLHNLVWVSLRFSSTTSRFIKRNLTQSRLYRITCSTNSFLFIYIILFCFYCIIIKKYNMIIWFFDFNYVTIWIWRWRMNTLVTSQPRLSSIANIFCRRISQSDWNIEIKLNYVTYSNYNVYTRSNQSIFDQLYSNLIFNMKNRRNGDRSDNPHTHVHKHSMIYMNKKEFVEQVIRYNLLWVRLRLIKREVVDEKRKLTQTRLCKYNLFHLIIL